MPSPLTVEQQSDEPTNWEVPVDHERLRYVTRLLGSQQGLNTALVGMLLLLAEISNPGGWWDLLALPASLLGIKIYLAASERWIPAYYQQRFGSVQATRKPWSKWDALLFLAFLVLLFVWIFFGQPIAHYLDPMASRLHILISDPGRQINLWPSLLWMWLFFSSVRWHIPSIERQRLLFLLGGLVAVSSITVYGILHPDARQFTLWKVLNAGELGLSLIAMGLYDHIILIRTLPKKSCG